MSAKIFSNCLDFILILFIFAVLTFKLHIMGYSKRSSLFFLDLSDTQCYDFFLNGNITRYAVFIGKYKIAEYKTRIAADMLVKLLKGSHPNISVVEYFLIPKDK